MNDVNHFQAPNARALNQLRTWLAAVGIQHAPSRTGNDLAVTSAGGATVEVQVVAGLAEARPGALVIKAGEITGRKLANALEMFRGLQEQLGYEPKSPVARGAVPEKKAHYTEDFELVAFRHMELRRVPNPSVSELKKYDSIITSVCWKFLSLNRTLCEDHLLDFEDLRSYAQVWTTNFLGLHAVPEAQATSSDNEKLLTNHLKQRFYSHFRELLHKKTRSVLPSFDAASIAQNGLPYDGGDFSREGAWVSATEDGNVAGAKLNGVGDRQFLELEERESDVDEAYVARHNELNTKNPTARRSSAAALLTKNLEALSHDRRVEVLQQAVENYYIHPDCQRLAARLLREHVKTCSACAGISVPSEEQEEVSGEDEAGSEE